MSVFRVLYSNKKVEFVQAVSWNQAEIVAYKIGNKKPVGIRIATPKEERQLMRSHSYPAGYDGE